MTVTSHTHGDPSSSAPDTEGSGNPGAYANPLHDHGHEHPGQPIHVHPHHHGAEPSLPPHAHAHATSYEALTYILSPVHALDGRAKLIAALVLVLGIVTTPALQALEFAFLVMLLAAVGVIARLPLKRVLARSAAVLPFVAMLALFAPLQAQGESITFSNFATSWSGSGWIPAWSLLSRVWLAAWCMALLTATTKTPDLLGALARLRVPDVFVVLLSFIARYMHVFASQLVSLRRSLASRAPGLRGRALLRSFGSIAGNLLVRSYERGERVHAAMLARGYTGTLPSTTIGSIGAPEILVVICSLLSWAVLALY